MFHWLTIFTAVKSQYITKACLRNKDIEFSFQNDWMSKLICVFADKLASLQNYLSPKYSTRTEINLPARLFYPMFYPDLKREIFVYLGNVKRWR